MTWATFWTILSLVDLVVVVVAIIVVLRRPREPLAMLTWVLTLLLLQLIGVVLFLMLGEPRFRRTRRRRNRRRQRIRRSLDTQLEPADAKAARRTAEQVDPAQADLMALCTQIGHRAPTTGNQVTIYHEEEQTFNDIVAAVENAKSTVHLEYYIYQPDETGRSLRDLLAKKAQAGVRCRLLVDYIGVWNWPRGFRESFTRAGVEVGYFLPVVPWRGRWRVNFRNHRKIAVMDGVTGFTGSQNIGDEYRGRREKYGPWRDTHLRVVGPGAHQLQEIFVEDWHYATGKDVLSEVCFPEPPRPGGHTVQVIPSGPDSDANIMHHLLLAAVASANESVAIITPYFAPDMTMILALQSAAYRGIRVQLLIPALADSVVTLWAGRSFYQELSEAGVEIYEYDHGMLHSKVVVVDNVWSMVGSANMDQRSFRINFEVTTLLYDRELAMQIRDDFESLRYDARRIKRAGREHWTFTETLKLGLARLVSPLL